MYAFNLRPVIKSWYKGKVFTAEWKDYKRCVYSITNCVVEEGFYYPSLGRYKHNIYLDVKVSEYYMCMRNNKWTKMGKPSSATIRSTNESIRLMIWSSRSRELMLFGIDNSDYKIKIRNIKWDVKYKVGE